MARPDGARRGLPLTSDPAIRRGFRSLLRRADAAAAASLARPEDGVRAVGGAVRDAFLGRRGGDLDLVAPPLSAERLATELATRAGSRVVRIGAPPKRILKVPFGAHEIDVWEEAEDAAQDLLRRDFTVNTLSFSLPGGAFSSAPGALDDLKGRRLAPPRPGVFLEDPLRVLRAARFLAELPRFHIARAAIPELRKAAKMLRMVAAERRLVELDKLLGAPAAGRVQGLRFLERVGALESLLLSSAPRGRRGNLFPGTAARQRRRGLSLVSRLDSRDPRVARALLLLPMGPKRAENSLRRWKTSREELRLAGRLYALPLSGPRAARRPPSRHDVAALLRLSSPFEAESIAFLLAAGDSRARELARAAQEILRRPASLRRILKPTRPLPFKEISSLLGLEEGPELGRALAAFDLALASSEIHGPHAARAWLRRLREIPRAQRPC